MKAFICFSFVLQISLLLKPCIASMEKRDATNAFEVTTDSIYKSCNRHMKSWPTMQYFDFDSSDYQHGIQDVYVAAGGFDFKFYCMYNCADKPEYCPSDLTQRTYRFYKNGELKETHTDYLAYWMIKDIMDKYGI